MNEFSEWSMGEVKNRIINNQQKIKLLSEELGKLIEAETNLIKQQNDCKGFLPPTSEFTRQHRCVRCGHWEAAHKTI